MSIDILKMVGENKKYLTVPLEIFWNFFDYAEIQSWYHGSKSYALKIRTV